MIEHGATEAAVVTRNGKEDRVWTSYYNCNFETRCALLGHMISDIVLEIIEINKDWIKEILESGDE